MFICEKCRTDGSWEYCRGTMHSFGACEICNAIGDCLDARQYQRRAAQPEGAQQGAAEPDEAIALIMELHNALSDFTNPKVDHEVAVRQRREALQKASGYLNRPTNSPENPTAAPLVQGRPQMVQKAIDEMMKWNHVWPGQQEALLTYITHLETHPSADAARIAELEGALEEAIESVEEWSAYASDYFKEKHDLEGDLSRLRAALTKPAAQGGK